MLTLFKLLYLLPILTALGSPDWKVRNKAHKRADNAFFAWVAPRVHHDPEVNRRINIIRDKYIWSPEQREIAIYEADPRLYWRLYVVPGENCFYTDREVLGHVKCHFGTDEFGDQSAEYYWIFRDEFKLGHTWEQHTFLSGTWEPEDTTLFRNFMHSRNPKIRSVVAGVAGASTLGEER